MLWSNPFINKQADWSKINMNRSCQCGADGRITPPRTGTGQQALNKCCRLRSLARFVLHDFCKSMYTRIAYYQFRHLSNSKLTCSKEIGVVSGARLEALD